LGERHASQDDELLEPGSDLRMGIGQRDLSARWTESSGEPGAGASGKLSATSVAEGRRELRRLQSPRTQLPCPWSMEPQTLAAVIRCEGLMRSELRRNCLTPF